MAKAQLLLLLVVLLSAGNAFAADPNIKVVEFTAGVCEPCKRMQPVIEKLASEGWEIQQLDVAEQSRIVQHFQVKSVPTIVILRQGQEVDRIVGTLGYEKLRARFERASGRQQSISNELNSLALVSSQPAQRASSEPRRSISGAPSTVRGQSPAISAFPLLSANTFGSITPAAGAPVAAPPGTREMAEAPVVEQQQLQQQLQPQQQSQLHPQQQLQPQRHPQQLKPHRPNVAPSADALATAGAATVRIRIDEANAVSFGTGTVISVHGEQALVLTCGHLFREIKPDAKLSVDVFHLGRPITVPATLVSFNAKEYDLGLVEFRLPIPMIPVRVAPVAEHPQIGDVAFSFGCDRGADPTRRDTQIKRINRYLGAANVEIHGAPVVGRSGGGLFDSQGRLVGVCNAADEEDNEGIYAALPIVHEHIASLNLQELHPEASAMAANAQPMRPAGSVQLASTPSSSNLTATAAPSNSATPGYWPDQNQAHNSLASSMTSITSSNTAAQVRCVIRDAAGQESAITIDHASEELLAMLRQHAQR